MTFENFFDALGELEWLDLLVAAIAVFVFAWIWYGPLFGNAWRSATNREMSTPDPMTMVQGFAKFFIFGIGVSWFVPALHVFSGNVTSSGLDSSFETLLVSAFVLGFFVIGMALASRVVWEGGPWSLWGIDFGFWFLAAFISAYVQDLMA